MRTVFSTGSALLTDPKRLCRSSISIMEGLKDKKPVIISNFLFDGYLESLVGEVFGKEDLFEGPPSSKILDLGKTGECSNTPYCHMFENFQAGEMSKFMSLVTGNDIVSSKGEYTKKGYQASHRSQWRSTNGNQSYFWLYTICPPWEGPDGGLLEIVTDKSQVANQNSIKEYEISHYLIPQANTLTIIPVDGSFFRITPVNAETKSLWTISGFYSESQK